VLRGSIVSYQTEVKRELLGVTADRVVSEECAREMAEGARKVTGADVGLAVTGVAGPDPQDGQPVGTVFFGLALPGRRADAVGTRLPGQREQVRQFATISLLNLLRMALLEG
jgi:PncC family amidohydrolase